MMKRQGDAFQKMRRLLRTAEDLKATRFLVITAGVIFVAEGAIMWLFHVLEHDLGHLTPQARGLLDAFLLTVVAFPALYAFLFRPLIVEMHHRKQAERSKDEFLSILPHELRTPLTIMQEGIDQMVGGHLGPVTPAQTECLQVVGQGVERLKRMFDKVVSVTHLLANTVEYTFEPVPMAQVMDALAKRLQPIAKQKGVTLRIDHDTQLPSCVVDAGRIVEALGEVVENGIAVTPAGRQAVLSCRAKFSGVEFSVQDEGPGIIGEELPVFFDRLHAVGDIDERKTGGLGLGLSIARAIINAHGGTISVSSAPGAGTCVVISIKKTPKSLG